MRSKEEAHDYRYFPDPDLLPLEIKQSFVDDIKRKLPELPDQKKKDSLINLNLHLMKPMYSFQILISQNILKK